MIRTLLLLGTLLALCARPFAAEPTPPVRERVLFTQDWRFTRGDPDWLPGQLDYTVLRDWLLPSSADFLSADAKRPSRPAGNIGGGVRYVQPDFDHSSWRKLDLPHDWGIEGPFRQEYDGNQGKLPWWGIAWYRKEFTLPTTDSGRRVSLEIDGAMSYAAVWLNGQFVGGWPYGYASFALDLTPFVKPGAKNVLAIRIDNVEASSRWYPGGGLYRNVWLVKTDPVHVTQWGTAVTTPQVTPERAAVVVTAQIRNGGAAAATLRVSTHVFELDPRGQRVGAPVASAEPTGLQVAPARTASTTQTVIVPQPKLWRLTDPRRYVAVTTVSDPSRVVDVYETPFGIRTIALDPDRGFLLNGEIVRLQGVCNHHDLGALGAAINVRALHRQLEILREMGCNAIRTSHNPPAPELLELCDTMGFLVVDEAFDCWAIGKNRGDYHLLFPDWHEQDLRALVRRDRNHPSVIMWSIGNEVLEQWGEAGQEGYRLAARLASLVREEDRSRFVTGGYNGEHAGYNGHQVVLDAMGYNYRVNEYARFRNLNPTFPLYGSETASTISSRGEYFFPVSDDKVDPASRVNFQVSSYDLATPPWATTPETEWRAADGAPGYAGEFVWTGFDYLGEPTPYGGDSNVLLNFSTQEEKDKAMKQLESLGRIPVPSRSSYFGIVDLAGFPKDRYYLYQSRWRPDLPMAHVLPHWTWPERRGEVTPVHVYTSGDEAELFLNGRSLGRKKKAAGEYRLRWDDVRYEPGEVRVVAYRQGSRWAEAAQRTSGPVARVDAKADRTEAKADGDDLIFVAVALTDTAGVLSPRANNTVQFSVQGPASVVAVDNGDATSFEPFQATRRRAFNGRALAIVRTVRGQPGRVTVRAESEGLSPAEVSFTTLAP